MACSRCKYVFCKYDNTGKLACEDYRRHTEDNKSPMCYTGRPSIVSPQDILEEKLKNVNGKFTRNIGERYYCEKCDNFSCDCPRICADCGAETSKKCVCRTCFKRPYIFDCECCEN